MTKMGTRLVVRCLLGILIIALPVTGYAQEATLTGTVTDNTGAVLPGVVVRAVHEASGNSFEAVSDGAGAYQLSVRIGSYQIMAELPGFAPFNREGLQLQVGQQAQVDVELALAGVAESVTVTGEAPLIDVTSSTLGGNIDQAQMEELPLNGRNWIDLTMLAPGSRLSGQDRGDRPNPGAFHGGFFQINLDGQQVSQWSAPTFGQPKYSRDAIAEFEFITNRFDATQGRSSGVQLNAITKSGTNTYAGSLSGYFRHDALNAADFIQDRVLPYQNQQVSVTAGGPIKLDRVHFFANYEYEREPNTFAYSTPFPSFNIDQQGTRTVSMGGARVDMQFTPQIRLAVRGAKSKVDLPCNRCGGGTRHPSSVVQTIRNSDDLIGTLTQVLGGSTVNEFRAGYSGYYWTEQSTVSWVGGIPDQLGYGPIGSPRISFNGFFIGQGNSLTPQRLDQDTFSFRDDFTKLITKGGRHQIKLGAEYLDMGFDHFLCSRCVGEYDARGGPIPDNIEELFPVWNDVNTWNLAPLSSIVRKYQRGIGDFAASTPRKVFAGWAQDDWSITDRLTLNLGVRYDVAKGLWSEDVEVLPFLKAGRTADKNNVAPRLGFAYSAGDRTVVRGGFGRYFAEVSDQAAWSTKQAAKVFSVEVLNDGRPDFASNPFNGPAPTHAEAVARWNDGLQLRTFSFTLADPAAQVPYSWQTSLGVERQLGDVLGIQADYVFTGTRHDQILRDINLAYNPATGANYPFTDASQKPYPRWGPVTVFPTDNRNDYHALQTAFTKRFSNNWQAAGTYSVSRIYQGDPLPINNVENCQFPMTAPGVCNVPITLAKDLGGDPYWTGVEHRAVFNGIWDIGYGFQVSGLYFYRNGIDRQSNYGADLRRQGGRSTRRLRPDGSIVPRNDFQEEALHRVDIRFSRRTGLGGSASIDGIFEVFNLLNHENFGSYITSEVSRNFGDPTFNSGIAYQPRIVQLGFRVTF